MSSAVLVLAAAIYIASYACTLYTSWIYILWMKGANFTFLQTGLFTEFGGEGENMEFPGGTGEMESRISRG